MTPYRTVRLNLHPCSEPERLAYSLLFIRFDSQGVPHAELVEHGVFDPSALDLVGLEAVAALLARAVAPTA